MIELTNYTGKLHIYVSAEHTEPSEADNQLQIHNVSLPSQFAHAN